MEEAKRFNHRRRWPLANVPSCVQHTTHMPLRTMPVPRSFASQGVGNRNTTT